MRLPDGSRCSAALRGDAPLAALFWLVDARAPAAVRSGRDFALATTFPRRRFLRPEDDEDHGQERGPLRRTLATEGLAGEGRLAFFAELL